MVTKEGWVSQHPTSRVPTDVITASYCNLVESCLTEVLQALADAQALLADSNRNNNVTPDLYYVDRSKLVMDVCSRLRLQLPVNTKMERDDTIYSGNAIAAAYRYSVQGLSRYYFLFGSTADEGKTYQWHAVDAYSRRTITEIRQDYPNAKEALDALVAWESQQLFGE